MMNLLTLLWDPAPFMPHGMCLLWDPGLIWLHLVSDVVTGLAYYSIPVALFVFVKRRNDLVYGWMFVLFGIFILACGTTHMYGAWTLWHPDYVAEGLVKGATALVSAMTAIMLWPLIPRALALPSPSQLARVNRSLSHEVEERGKAEAAARASAAELQEALRELRASEARHAGIVQNVADCIFVVDVGSDGQFRFAAVNPALERDTGITADRLIGRTPEEALDPRWSAGVAARYAACVAARTPLQYEEVAEGPDGRRIWETALVPVIDPASGHVVQLVGTSRNVTALRRMQEELAQSAKLATLGTMAAGVAHEMSQPLNAIRIVATDAAQVMEEAVAALPACDRQYVKESLQTIAAQSARMGGIVDQMRQYARRSPADSIPFDPGPPVSSAVSLLERQFAAEGIVLELRKAASLSAVAGQPGKLEQVAVNLLANARDAILERRRRGGPDLPDGRITVTLDTDAAGNVVLCVEDNGIGLTPELARRIFDPFFSTKDGEKGLGLGLSICASIVAAAGGRIEAVPIQGGARFVVTLPACRGGTAPSEVVRP